MVVRIRLARPPGHTKRTTWFDLVVINIRKARDAKPIEKLGEYDPVPRILGTGPGAGTPGTGHKRVEWSAERIRYWLGQGALPSKSAAALLTKGGLIPPKDPGTAVPALHTSRQPQSSLATTLTQP
ncbi:37S ribosomal protein S16, mitochondrial [Tulasnella sp. JGI-2019a]|nr:37S ribosomal protein S16, mitochondrial [Tulasnella sp. JGI-2019a]KAG9013487.1 37S ribosomal protein S16, mitochondrial [Tulasnella sp. JGI-2019a]KAG9037313.1 37S ribosomal protein S16, mitochondrial [Tulasnella sp. JGI-2019a]